MQGVGKHNHSY